MMKKQLLILTLSAISSLLVGCGGGASESSSSTSSSSSSSFSSSGDSSSTSSSSSSSSSSSFGETVKPADILAKVDAIRSSCVGFSIDYKAYLSDSQGTYTVVALDSSSSIHEDIVEENNMAYVYEYVEDETETLADPVSSESHEYQYFEKNGKLQAYSRQVNTGLTPYVDNAYNEYDLDAGHTLSAIKSANQVLAAEVGSVLALGESYPSDVATSNGTTYTDFEYGVKRDEDNNPYLYMSFGLANMQNSEQGWSFYAGLDANGNVSMLKTVMESYQTTNGITSTSTHRETYYHPVVADSEPSFTGRQYDFEKDTDIKWTGTRIADSYYDISAISDTPTNEEAYKAVLSCSHYASKANIVSAVTSYDGTVDDGYVFSSHTLTKLYNDYGVMMTGGISKSPITQDIYSNYVFGTVEVENYTERLTPSGSNYLVSLKGDNDASSLIISGDSTFSLTYNASNSIALKDSVYSMLDYDDVYLFKGSWPTFANAQKTSVIDQYVVSSAIEDNVLSIEMKTTLVEGNFDNRVTIKYDLSTDTLKETDYTYTYNQYGAARHYTSKVMYYNNVDNGNLADQK